MLMNPKLTPSHEDSNNNNNSNDNDNGYDEDDFRYRIDGRLHHTPLDGYFAAASASAAISTAPATATPSSKTKPPPPIVVLDASSHQGRWARCMAREYPGIQIVAMDPSVDSPDAPPLPRQRPQSESRPPSQAALLIDDNTFDLVYVRGVSLKITKDARPAVLEELKRVAKDGGFVQLVEPHWRFRGTGPVGLEVYRTLERGYVAAGMDPDTAVNLDAYLMDLGLVDIVEGSRAVPIGWRPPNPSHSPAPAPRDFEWPAFVASLAASWQRLTHLFPRASIADLTDPDADAIPVADEGDDNESDDEVGEVAGGGEVVKKEENKKKRKKSDAPPFGFRVLLEVVREELSAARAHAIWFFACGRVVK
ncbi:hypothetical protein DFJ73DRAFT_896712 [Zopfochytrium polystomum]|nr:hypothetical protein DFJ73DRAFT_896712 [Zopfochytrium polystomum]